MNLHRVSKKNAHHDTRETVDSLHSRKMEEFEKLYSTLPDKEKELEALLIEYEAIPKIGTTRRERFSKLSHISALKKEIKKLKNRTDENEYLLVAAPLLLKYHQEKSRQMLEEEDENSEEESKSSLGQLVRKKGTRRNGKIYREFVETCYNGICDLNMEIDPDILRCKNCKVNLVIDPKEACACCPECGISKNYQDYRTAPQWSEECEALSPFAYKRINHFREWLAQLQAKETTEIPQDVIDALYLELKKERIENPKQITTTKIKGYLKKLRLNKWYEHAPSIINRLCGRQPPEMTPNLEGQLIRMFKEVQAPFERHLPTGRKNFLSYSYTLHKFCQLLGQNQFLDFFPLLKSREKLYAQDCIWKGICTDLGWDFHPSL